MRNAHDYGQCLRFTGIILVFGAFLILFGVVWYGGMEKWYVKPLLILGESPRCGRSAVHAQPGRQPVAVQVRCPFSTDR